MDARRHPEGMNPAEQAVVQERIAQAKSGNAEAWGELYRQYAPAIFRFCRRAMPTREDAEDATMDIFIKVRQKLSQYDSSRPFTRVAVHRGRESLLGSAAPQKSAAGPGNRRSREHAARASRSRPARTVDRATHRARKCGARSTSCRRARAWRSCCATTRR